MANIFDPTIQTYNQYSTQFAEYFEKHPNFTNLNRFLELVPEGGYILDAGCGSARDAAYFIKHKRRAIGIDLAEKILVEAHVLHPEVPTQVMSLNELTFESATFNGIWCMAALLHIDKQQVPKVTADFYRILKPGGTLFIQTKRGEGQLSQVVPFAPTKERLFTLFESEELQNLIEKAGFIFLESRHFLAAKRSNGAPEQEWIVLFAQKPSSM